MFLTKKYTYVEVIPTEHEIYGTVYNLRATDTEGNERIIYSKFFNEKDAINKLGAETEVLL